MGNDSEHNWRINIAAGVCDSCYIDWSPIYEWAHLQESVDLRPLFPYLKDYLYDFTTNSGHAFYILPADFVIDIPKEKIVRYFGKDTTLAFTRKPDSNFERTIYLELIPGVKYTIIPPTHSTTSL